MSYLRVAAVASVVAGLALYHGGVFDAPPAISRPSADVLLVGDAGAGTNVARYLVGGRCDFAATVVDYSFSTGAAGGGLSHLGARATLSYADDDAYRGAWAMQRRTGACFADCLDGYRAGGKAGHVILVPESPAAMAAMREVRLKIGNRFRVAGQWLQLDSVRRDGNRVSFQLNGSRFLLVSAISRASD